MKLGGNVRAKCDDLLREAIREVNAIAPNSEAILTDDELNARFAILEKQEEEQKARKLAEWKEARERLEREERERLLAEKRAKEEAERHRILGMAQWRELLLVSQILIGEETRWNPRTGMFEGIESAKAVSREACIHRLARMKY